jgi:polygalacturonase
LLERRGGPTAACRVELRCLHACRGRPTAAGFQSRRFGSARDQLAQARLLDTAKEPDLSIDGTTSGFGGGSSNGIRIKADEATGGSPGVTNVTSSDVCVRNLANPILLTPHYTPATGTAIPLFTNITIQNFHALTGTLTPTVTLDGFDTSHLTTVTLDNVVIDGSNNVTATDANVTLGPGNVNFTPSGTNVTVTNNISGTSTPNPCTNKWVTF